MPNVKRKCQGRKVKINNKNTKPNQNKKAVLGNKHT